MHTKEELIAIAYQYYPQGMYHMDEGYENTSEHQNLQKVFKKRKELWDRWDRFTKDVHSFFTARYLNTVICSNPSFIEGNGSGFKGMLKFKPEPGGIEKIESLIVFHLSLIVPYYAIYEANHRILYKEPKHYYHSEPNCTYNFNISEKMQPIVEDLKALIESEFKGYQEFPPSLLETGISNVIYDAIGYLENTPFPPDPKDKKITFFEAFFTTHLLYVPI